MVSTDVILESFRAIVLLVLVGYLWRLGKKKDFIVTSGWRFIQFGFLLILFGSFLDITDNFETLNPYVVVGDTETEAFLEKVVGYLVGFIFLTIGLIQWGPTVEQLMGEVAERKQAEDALQQAHGELEGKVEERTAALKEEINERKQTEKILIESEQRFRALYHQSPLGVTLEDYSSAKSLIDRLKNAGVSDFRRHFQDHPDDLKQAIMGIRVLDANDTMNEMYDAASFKEYYNYEERLTLWDNPDWHNFYIGELAALAAGDLIFSNEVEDELPDGSLIELRCITRIIKGHEDDWSEIITTHEDITERKTIENIVRNIAEGVSGATGKNFFDTLVEFLARALDIDHVFVGRLSESGEAIQTISFFSNNKITDNFEYQLKGSPCENIVGKSLDIYEKEVAERFPEDLALKEMGIEGYAGAPLFDTLGQPLGILVVLSETPLKLQEMVQSLLLIFATRASTELEREIALEKIRGSMDEAEKANRAKSEFLASMSHELRTPLNAVLGFAQMMQFDPKNSLSPAQEVHVESILEGGNHLLQLVNEVLDLAKIEADQFDLSLKEVIANEVITACVTMTSPLGKQRGIKIVNQFSDGPPTYLRTDRLRLKQVLINLLSNAVKFNKDGGTVTVDGQETDDGFLLISITDTGVGIAKEDYASVFQLFHRLGSDPMIAHEGTGIGLTVTKLLVERMAGRIGFESDEGAGSMFWIELPLASNEDVLIWNDVMRIGVDAIDRDHQILVSLLNKVTHRPADEEDMDGDIEKLIDYIHYHFRREEAVMEVCGYPELEKHRNHHLYLTGQINDLAKAWHKDRNLEIQGQLRECLRGLLFTDILKTDTDITRYAKGKDQDIRKALETL